MPDDDDDDKRYRIERQRFHRNLIDAIIALLVLMAMIYLVNLIDKM